MIHFGFRHRENGRGRAVSDLATLRRRAADGLALEPATSAVAFVVFVQTLAEQLWIRFVPKVLEVLGAPVVAIGWYGTLHDLLDGLYQFPGGWLSDRFGRRRALVAFVILAVSGYAVYGIASDWRLLVAGLPLVMAWKSMASPSLFAIIGDRLPPEKRAMGFTVQAMLRRTALAAGPLIGGWLIARHGLVAGFRAGVWAAVALGVGSIVLLLRMRDGPVARNEHESISPRLVWRTFPKPLRALLVSDVFIRTSEGLVDVFVVLWATNVVGIDAGWFGALVAIQMVTSMVVSLPAARAADRFGRKRFVVATFLAFALYPFAIAASQDLWTLAAAFVVGGLREIGEPARKAMIVDLADARLRGRSVGLYYLLRSVAIAPAAVVGGLLWQIAPTIPFIAAGAVGLVGTAVFVVTVEERHAA